MYFFMTRSTATPCEHVTSIETIVQNLYLLKNVFRLIVSTGISSNPTWNNDRIDIFFVNCPFKCGWSVQMLFGATVFDIMTKLICRFTHIHSLTLSKCVDGVIRRVVCYYNKVFSVRGSGFHSDSFLHVSMETADLSSRQGHVDEVSVRVILLINTLSISLCVCLREKDW